MTTTPSDMRGGDDAMTSRGAEVAGDTGTPVPGAGDDDGAGGWSWRPSGRALVVQLVGVFVVALVPRLLTIGRFVTTDEANWMTRSTAFSDALAGGDLSQASASIVNVDGRATMPGTPVMWLGSIGRLVWRAARKAGVHDDARFAESLSGLATAQAMVAVATALLIAVIAWLVFRWAGWGAAAVTGAVLATDPWMTGLGSLVHTDELTALFGVAGLLMVARAFDVPEETGVTRPLLAAGLAGVVLVHAPLTKILGAGYGVGAAAMIGFALVRDWNRESVVDGARLRSLRVRQVLVVGACAVVTVLVSWPALLADTGTQVQFLVDSARLGDNDQGQMQFFLGEVTTSPGWGFYPVALLLRTTPWLLLGVLVGVPVALVSRRTRVRAIWVVVWMLPPFLAIARASLQYDRYALVALVPLVVLVGLGLGPSLARLVSRSRPARFASAAAVAVLAVHAVAVAPWGLLYFNPLVGGGATAEDAVLVGWGEGVDVALERISEMEGGDCANVTVEGARPGAFGRALPAQYARFGFACSERPSGGERATYTIAYVNQVQRMTDRELEVALAGREQVAEVRIRGITVATIWRAGPETGSG